MGMMDQFKAEWEAMKQRDRKERMQHLWEYYRWHILVLIVLLCFIVSTIWSAMIRKDVILSGVLLNSTNVASEEVATKLENDFINKQGLDSEKVQVELNTYWAYKIDNEESAADSYSTLEYLTTLVAGEMLDFVTGDLDALSALAYSDYFEDLSTVLSEEQMKLYEPYLLYIDLAVIEKLEEMAKSENFDVEIAIPECDDPENMEKPIPMFVDMSQSEYLTAIYSSEENPLVFAVAINAPNNEVIQDFVDFMMEN